MVVNQQSDEVVDRVFQALADATRRDILARAAVDELSVTALAAGYAMSFAAVQKHVAVLVRAGLVTKRRRGREQLVQSDPRQLERARALLEQYESLWRHRAAGMERLLAEGLSGASPSTGGERRRGCPSSVPRSMRAR